MLGGRLVAVKVLTKLETDGEEFINGVASISRTSHINTVNLLGFCHERTERALQRMSICPMDLWISLYLLKDSHK